MQSTYPSSCFEQAQDEEGASSSLPTTRQCFSSIQSRKLWGPSCPNTCRLCPSMDLAVLGVQTPPTSASASTETATTTTTAADTSTVASSLWIHRTVSWQRLATLSFEKQEGINRVTWSPDGRHLALGCSEKVLLYQVESLSNQTGGGSYGVGGEATPSHTLQIKDVEGHHHHHHPKIFGLTWAHVGRPHPTAWKLSESQVEDQISWRYRSRYLDRSSVFLPPSEYDSVPLDVEGDGGGNAASFLPTCKTPLSLLCVSTEQNHELYLHGRYHLLSLPRSPSGGSLGGMNHAHSTVDVACSIDLTQLLVHEQGSTRLSLYSLPTLLRNRYHLQTVTALHSSIMSHLAALQQNIPESANSWKSSMKPLNAKLEPLQRLLSNYGVDEPEAAVLRQYILIGHTSASSNMANAMDQFFTGVQMNDQLLQRMERSLQGGLANVETMIRKCLVSPARALVYHVGELVGVLRFHTADDNDNSSDANNVNESEIRTFQRASEMVLLSAETLLTQVIESRFRLRDFVAWLRSTGSQIKARGTAIQSVQRENAKKRRVSEAVMQRVLSYLEPGTNFNPTDSDTRQRSGTLTERLLGMKVSDLLRETPQFVSTATKGRPSSPTSVLPNKLILSSNTPSLAYATHEATKAAEVVFAQPRNSMKEFVIPKDFILPRVRLGAHVAIHTRLGRDQSLANDISDCDEDEDADGIGGRSFFSPKVAVTSESNTFGLSSFDFRQWSIVSQVGHSDGDNSDFIQFFAIPLGWKDPVDTDCDDIDDDDDDDDDDGNDTNSDAPFYLTSKLVLPPGCTVRDLAFYSDDGKSALSSGTDSGTGKESRQKIGFLLCRAERLELWLVTYDSLRWQAVPFESLLLEPQCIEAPCCVSAKPLPATMSSEDWGEDEMDDEENPTVLAQVRVMAVLPSGGSSSPEISNTMLMLSGSRGVGGVSWTTDSVTSLELLDLEEDEEDDDDEEEDE